MTQLDNIGFGRVYQFINKPLMANTITGNPNWQEADQLAIYKCSRGVEPGTTWLKSS